MLQYFEELPGNKLAGAVTRAMARERARELAQLAGGHPLQVTRDNYEQAKRELTGESDPDRQDAIFDGERAGALSPVTQALSAG
jgi:hypothetical protein